MPAEKTQLDTNFNIITPENIGFEYRLAGPFRRLPAYLFDLVLRWALVVAAVMVLVCSGAVTGLSGAYAIALMMVVTYVLEWFYGGLFETLWNGQTPGKRLMGLRVVTQEGEPIDGMAAIVRNLMRAIDILPFCPIIGVIAMSMNRRMQRLGDIVAGTVVVIEERHWLTGVMKLEDPRAIQLAGLLPPDMQVSRTMARTLATYVERRLFFSVPRRREVAAHLAEPLLRRFNLPPDTSYDLLLCAMYYRTFIADRKDDERHAVEAGVSPFQAGMLAR